MNFKEKAEEILQPYGTLALGGIIIFKDNAIEALEIAMNLVFEATKKECIDKSLIEISYHRTDWNEDLELEKPNYFKELNNVELFEELGGSDNVLNNNWKATIYKESILNINKPNL